ncbi:MAG: hypothetical protein J0L92_13115 [Deltaproteobacteria bacterium]|nr:hypothetical protein [Deltaproteobacteria bacterium]
MKPAESRRLALEKSADELASAIEALSEEKDPPFEIAGADHGEMLTNVLLAQRIRERIDRGEDAKDAFRAVMGEVRAVVSND